MDVPSTVEPEPAVKPPARVPWRHKVNGAALRDIREHAGWTAKRFCVTYRVSRQYLDDVEKGRQQPSRMWVYAVANHLGVDWWELCDELADEDDDVERGAA